MTCEGCSNAVRKVLGKLNGESDVNYYIYVNAYSYCLYI